MHPCNIQGFVQKIFSQKRNGRFSDSGGLTRILFVYYFAGATARRDTALKIDSYLMYLNNTKKSYGELHYGAHIVFQNTVDYNKVLSMYSTAAIVFFSSQNYSQMTIILSNKNLMSLKRIVHTYSLD